MVINFLLRLSHGRSYAIEISDMLEKGGLRKWDQWVLEKRDWSIKIKSWSLNVKSLLNVHHQIPFCVSMQNKIITAKSDTSVRPIYSKTTL
jgi:hypothetical protein